MGTPQPGAPAAPAIASPPDATLEPLPAGEAADPWDSAAAQISATLADTPLRDPLPPARPIRSPLVRALWARCVVRIRMCLRVFAKHEFLLELDTVHVSANPDFEKGFLQDCPDSPFEAACSNGVWVEHMLRSGANMVRAGLPSDPAARSCSPCELYISRPGLLEPARPDTTDGVIQFGPHGFPAQDGRPGLVTGVWAAGGSYHAIGIVQSRHLARVRGGCHAPLGVHHAPHADCLPSSWNMTRAARPTPTTRNGRWFFSARCPFRRSSSCALGVVASRPFFGPSWTFWPLSECRDPHLRGKPRNRHGRLGWPLAYVGPHPLPPCRPGTGGGEVLTAKRQSGGCGEVLTAGDQYRVAGGLRWTVDQLRIMATSPPSPHLPWKPGPTKFALWTDSSLSLKSNAGKRNVTWCRPGHWLAQYIGPHDDLGGAECRWRNPDGPAAIQRRQEPCGRSDPECLDARGVVEPQ
jgi:hypothetical protein